jgi:hypothetical protein
MRPNRRALATTTAAVVVLLTAACGGGNPEPAPLPQASTPKVSPSASSTPSAPVLPAAAKTKTKAGAIAAVRYFLDAMAYAGESGNTQPFKTAYTRECTRCRAITSGIEGTYAAGGQLKGGAWRPTRLKFYGISNGVAYVDAIVTFESQVLIKDSQGTKVTSPESRDNLKPFQLVRLNGIWRVAALDPEA